MSDQTQPSRQKFIVFGIAIAIVIIVIAVVKSNNGGGGGNQTADPAIGPQDAKVVVKEYSDFQCPACKAVAPIVKDVLEEYGDTIRFEYNDFPLPRHEYSSAAAIAAQCAFDQNKFTEYHDILFYQQNTWAQAASREAAQGLFEQYAQDIGLDVSAFTACTTSEDIAERIDEDKAEARGLGVNQTPTFFVNGKRVIDTPFSSSLRDAIATALAK